MYHKPALCLAAALCLAVTVAYSQVDPELEQLRTVVPPSPNASSLGKFGEWPVSLYTGLPNIDIPIYSLKGRSLSVPISIDYHSAGVRVGEVASWVGLGWALNSGGCVSRTVQGLPDEQGLYFSVGANYPDPNNFCGHPTNTNTFEEVVGGSAQGEQDTQEDSYNLNVLGRSYKIIIRSDTTAFTVPASNIKITTNFVSAPDPESSTWTAVLEDGTKLLFGGSYTDSTGYVEMTDNSRTGGVDFPSTWYLQTMTAPTGETITFTYAVSNITQNTHYTQSDYIEYWTSTTVNAGGTVQPFLAYPSASSHGEYQTINQLSPKAIESDLTRVTFTPSTTARMDLMGGTALSQIQVTSKLTNTVVENWLFSQTYTRCAPGNEVGGSDTSYYHYRLKLMSLTKQATDTSASEVWSFAYNPTSLPSSVSYAQDYWGFYNGATTNTSILPTVPFNPNACTLASGYYPFSNIGFINNPGQNISPNAAFMQAESLTKITYPTGGYTVFNFEANSTPATQELFADTTVNLSILDDSSHTFVGSTSFTFTITKPEYISYIYSATISSAILHDESDATVYMAISGSGGGIMSYNTVGVTSGASSAMVNLYTPGTYTLTLGTENVGVGDFPTSAYIVRGSLQMQYSPSKGVISINKMLGGLRLNSMQEYDGINPNPINSKYYIYDSAFVINPVDSINDYITSQSKVVSVASNQYIYALITRNSSTKYAIGGIPGGTVGYGKVTTYDGLNGANGYTVSSFTCDPVTQDDLRTSLQFPYPPNDQRGWRNGLLINENTYTAGGQLLKTVKNSYGFTQTFQLSNFKVGYSTIGAAAIQPFCAGYTFGFCGTQPQCFTVTNEWVQHLSSTAVTYDVSNGNPLSTTTHYYYDDTLNVQPTRTISLDSKGDTILTYSRSPLELSAINSSISLTGPATAALDTMIARNIVGQAVETERYVAGVLDYKGLTNYQVQSTGLVLPANVMIQNSSYPIETRVNFLEYDNYGNLLQQAKANDVNHNYIYDYTMTYPIAEVVNGDSTSIAATSFESNGTGGWTLGTGAVDTTKWFTGSKSFAPTAAITRSGLSSGKTYVLSCWTTAGSSPTVSGTIAGYPIKGKTISIGNSTWTYYEYEITGVTSASVSSSGNIDELRLYPVGAQMTTYTYIPLIGLSSQCDVDNRITYYQYDGLNRLKVIKDQDGNILKTIDYHYVSH